MKALFLLTCLGMIQSGCGGYKDPRPDPTTQPGFVDTADPRALMGSRGAEQEAGKGKKPPKSDSMKQRR
jgi:hypothetical protein